MAFMVFAALLAVAIAAPQYPQPQYPAQAPPQYAAPAPQYPAPAAPKYAPARAASYDDQAVPTDYKFSVDVKDDASYNQQTREESKYGDAISGVYTVLQPDGLTRVVKYEDTGYGLVADVSYTGGYSAPSYQPAAAPYQPPAAPYQPPAAPYQPAKAPAYRPAPSYPKAAAPARY